MGAASVSLCSTSDETIADAERELPKNLCPLIKSSTQRSTVCPFFYFSDVVVGETTCDGKKKMYEYMAQFKDVYIMELPNTQREDALKLWRNEIIRFKEYLEKKFNVTITEDDIRRAIKINNAGRRSLKRSLRGDEKRSCAHHRTGTFQSSLRQHLQVQPGRDPGRGRRPGGQDRERIRRRENAGEEAQDPDHRMSHWRRNGEGDPSRRGQWRHRGYL